MTPPPLLQPFVDPDPKYSPVPLWWWSGEKLDINKMRWQMDQLLAMGIRNVCQINLAPSGTMYCCDPDDPPFLSEEWWTIFGQVCDHARQIGMSVWFYDQIGFSGASYQAEIATKHPEFLAEQLRSVSAQGTGLLRVECPGGGTPVAAYVVTLDEVEHVRYLKIDGRAATVEAKTLSRLRIVYALRQGYDLFSRAACEKLLDTVHREFERRLPQHLGTTIVGSFQDELPDLPGWGPTFAQTFEKKYGYKLQEVVHRLFEEGDADARRTRVHYHSHRADLSEAALFKPWFEWHEQRRLQCGFDQQSPAREARALGCVQKYADYIQTHRWYAAPGCDLHGNGKLHSSIAAMYDRPRVWIEGFHSTGWGGTIADTFDWLIPYLQSGANLYDPHAVYYSTRKGWWEWAPPSTCWRQPYAMHYKPFADMICRLTKILSIGVQQSSVGVMFPSTTVQSAVGPENHFDAATNADRALHETIGSMRWHEWKTGPLDEIGLDFHILDEPTIATGELRGDAIVFRDMPIHTIVLPNVTLMHDATLERLSAFAKAGGRLVSVGADEVETTGGKKARISALANARVIESAGSLKELLRDAPRLIDAPVPTLYRKLGDLHVLFVPAATGMATVVDWPSWNDPMGHSTIVPERYRKSVKLKLPVSAESVMQFDPRDGTMRAIRVHARAVELDFKGSPFAVLAWSENDAAAMPQAETGSTSAREVPIAPEWSCEYVPTLPTDFVDAFDPNHPEYRLPHTTEFRWHRGDGDQSFSRGIPEAVASETVRATFGVRAWRDGDPLIYSSKFGIQQDRLHLQTLGPKGHVPDEFIDLGKLNAGQSATIRTGVQSDRQRDVLLAIGSNGMKSARVNDRETAGGAESGYLALIPVTLVAGANPIEITLTSQRGDESTRAFWCLVEPGAADLFKRPERILPADAQVAGSVLNYRKRFHVDRAIVAGQVKLSTAAVSSIYLDGALLGRQGGFDPYRLQTRGQIYSTPALAEGEHELRVESIDPGKGGACVVDFRAGEVSVISDATWTVARDGGPERQVQLFSKPDADGAAWHLYRRPHPLPGATWLDERNNAPVVLDLPLIPPVEKPETQWFQWMIPPGATAMRLPLIDVTDIRLWIDGAETKLTDTIALGTSASRPRRAVLRVSSRQLGGGVFSAPATYDLGPGILSIGSWVPQGLRSYSGAIRMKQTIQLPDDDNATLDLGHVRGTVECFINGRSAGVRFIAPYRFDLSGLANPGANELELVVTNTLANHMSTWSPTRVWSPDQLECGILGPVKLTCESFQPQMNADERG